MSTFSLDQRWKIRGWKMALGILVICAGIISENHIIFLVAIGIGLVCITDSIEKEI